MKAQLDPLSIKKKNLKQCPTFFPLDQNFSSNFSASPRQPEVDEQWERKAFFSSCFYLRNIISNTQRFASMSSTLPFPTMDYFPDHLH